MRLSKVFTKLKKGGDGVDISPDSNKTSQLLLFLNIISANMRLLIVPLQKKDAFPLTSELIKELQYSDMYKGINTMFEDTKNFSLKCFKDFNSKMIVYSLLKIQIAELIHLSIVYAAT